MARAPVPVIMGIVVKCVTAVRMAITRKSRTILTQSAIVRSQIHFIDYQNEIFQYRIILNYYLFDSFAFLRMHMFESNDCEDIALLFV